MLLCNLSKPISRILLFLWIVLHSSFFKKFLAFYNFPNQPWLLTNPTDVYLPGQNGIWVKGLVQLVRACPAWIVDGGFLLLHTGLISSRSFQNYAFKGWLSPETMKLWLLVLKKKLFFIELDYESDSLGLFRYGLTPSRFCFK